MNFFEHQHLARRRSRLLVFLFILAVLAITLAVDLVLALTFASVASEDRVLSFPGPQWLSQNAVLMGWCSLGVIVLIASASLYRIARLRGGGAVVARSLGGTEVDSSPDDPRRRRLRNVVEEIAIASGVPVPDIYVLEKEGGINAFAAGFGTDDAAIAVSRGCLEKLNRQELQGVVAHEFSHVLNGDMRLNIRLMGVLFGILMIGLAGRHILQWGRFGGSRKGAPMALAGLGLLAIGFIGVLFARLIQAAVSRQREFLADASSVQFTRNPEGISGALKKIAASGRGALLESADGEEVGHMLFADGLGRRFFATHPPILDRIRAVDPDFSPRELKDLAARMALQPEAVDEGPDRPGSASALQAGASAQAPNLIAQIGNPAWDHVVYAAALIEHLPPPLRDAAHSDLRSVELVLALLLDSQAPVRDRQLNLIEERLGSEHRAGVERLLEGGMAVDPARRLPLIELALPTLKKRPPSALRVYLKLIEDLIRADGEITIFEYALARLVSDYLVGAQNPSSQLSDGRSLRACRPALHGLFAVLADAGHEDAEKARRAFQAGLNTLFPMDTPDYGPPEDWVPVLDVALEQLDELAPHDKESLLEGLQVTLGHDGQITLDELELLRAICASLHCPMPPRIEAA